MASKRLPLSVQQTEGNEKDISKELNLPKGERFYLMASYQRTKKQKIAFILSILLFFTGFPAFILFEKNNPTTIIISILLTISWLLSLLLFTYSFGVFDHSEKWLSYLLIIDTEQINTYNHQYITNIIYLFQESTKQNYALTAKLENIQFNDINIIEQKINSFIIEISGIEFNEYAVSNKNAAHFVNDVINYLDDTKDCDDTKQITQKGEYKKISKAKCSALGCDICSFNLCSYIIMVWFIITSAIFVIVARSVYREYCTSQKYDDIYDTKYNNQHVDDGCDDDVVTLLNTWRIVWIIGIIVSICGLFGLYHLKQRLFIFVIIYAAIRAIFWQIMLVIAVKGTVFIIPVLTIIIHVAEMAILVKTYLIMKSSVTVSYLKNRMNEMEEVSKLKNVQEKGIEIVLNTKSPSLS